MICINKNSYTSKYFCPLNSTLFEKVEGIARIKCNWEYLRVRLL